MLNLLALFIKLFYNKFYISLNKNKLFPDVKTIISIKILKIFIFSRVKLNFQKEFYCKFTIQYKWIWFMEIKMLWIRSNSCLS